MWCVSRLYCVGRRPTRIYPNRPKLQPSQGGTVIEPFFWFVGCLARYCKARKLANIPRDVTARQGNSNFAGHRLRPAIPVIPRMTDRIGASAAAGCATSGRPSLLLLNPSSHRSPLSATADRPPSQSQEGWGIEEGQQGKPQALGRTDGSGLSFSVCRRCYEFANERRCHLSHGWLALGFPAFFSEESRQVTVVSGYLFSFLWFSVITIASPPFKLGRSGTRFSGASRRDTRCDAATI